MPREWFFSATSADAAHARRDVEHAGFRFLETDLVVAEGKPNGVARTFEPDEGIFPFDEMYRAARRSDNPGPVFWAGTARLSGGPEIFLALDLVRGLVVRAAHSMALRYLGYRELPD
ncbi:hypothetical protein [Kineosporia sp. NBRC 101731]|uniref:hypothetical protein n=1 Tax=Kineosporia sp. NBRC 101731 TaxID=3032199 RepID=UPI0024A33406|nr:hypothetical protein [Kineosporia sp. NBRC 101731]GLY29530.1 hypothetical protein Kisp02_28950 [Kineosporia sp. NBRC 101731]